MNQKVCIFFVLILAGLVVPARIAPRQSLKSQRTAKTRILLPKAEVLEDLFNVYEPSFLAVVWPKIKNGVHLFLNTACWNDVSVFFKDLVNGRAWAFSAVDASGRYESGLFKGNTFWLGSKTECLQLDNRYRFRSNSSNDFANGDYLNTVLRKEKYFLAGTENWRSLVQRDELMTWLVTADSTPPYRMAYTSIQLSLNLTKVTMAEAYSITLGVCLPRSCKLEDVSSLMTFSLMINDNLKSNKTIPRVVKVNSLRKVEWYYDLKNDIGALILICVTLLLVIICVVATLVELKLIKCKPRNRKSMSFDLQKYYNKVDSERVPTEENKLRNCNILTKKESNIVDTETLTINNMNNSNNINLVTVKKVMKPNVMPPSITLDVVSMERVTGSCRRCGRYKQQCHSNNPRHTDNLPACPRVKSFASITTEPLKPEKEHFMKSILLCFSLRYSWKRIFNTNMTNKDLSVIHIWKIIATFWIIFIHVSVIASYASENGGDINEFNNVYYILITGALAFDTLFFVSGLFSAHHFFFLKSKYTVEQLVSFGGVCGSILQFVCFVTNRAIRLLPSYAYAIFLSGVAARVSRRTAAVELPDSEDIACDAYWWRNLLYITTVFPRKEQCMQISWAMSTETQLHMFGALACALTATGARVVVAIVAAAILVATAADISGAYAEFGHHVSSSYAAYSTFIERPLARVAPYFVGMLAGWLVIRLEGRMHISKTKSVFLWVSCVTVAMLSAGAAALSREWVWSWLHTVWPLALLWPALHSATALAAASRSVLEAGAVAALSRLCYGALLLHGPAARALLLAADTALCSRTVCIWWYFAGTSVVTVAGSLLLSLLVETPSCTLLRRLSDYAS